MKSLPNKKICALLLLSMATAGALFYNNTIGRPNVIFIILDAARADHFSCYGYPKNTTPNIDKIADKGILFKNHFSQDTYTIRSVSKIFYSRYFAKEAIQNDAGRWGIKLEYPYNVLLQPDEEQILLTGALALSGYKNAIFPQHNYDYNYKGSGFIKSFDGHFLVRRDSKGYHNIKYMADDEIISKTFKWLNKNRNKRFFVYWHVMFPHRDYPSGIEHKEFLEGIDEEIITGLRQKIKNAKGDETTENLTDEELKCLIGLYDSSLRYADTLVGMLYKRLRAMGILNKTLLIITSDHGESLGEHGYLFHGGLPWDPVTKVPLIISCPSLLRAGCSVESFTESVDIAPTILDISGVNLPEGKSFDGKSLLACLNNPKEYKNAVFTGNSIRTKEYRYIFVPRGNSGWLYDIKKDPQEKDNIFDKEPGLRKILYKQFIKKMRPYIYRYKNSKRTSPPDYPFYIRAGEMNILPDNAIEKIYLPDEGPVRDFTREKPWLANTHFNSYKVFRLPGKKHSPPIALSSDLPSGVYGIYLLLGTTRKLPASTKDIGLMYRFDKENNFYYPHGIRLFKNVQDAAFYYYLYLGGATVTDNKFSVEIDFQPPDNNLYAIYHIRFVPDGVKDDITIGDSPSSDKEFIEKVKLLKSLGYL